MEIIETLESEVRSYSRTWPTVFSDATGAVIRDESGREYLDFFAGAGSLNYGHNNPLFKKAAIDYLGADGVIQGLDMATSAKISFLEAFSTLILQPRNLPYKVQFTGPTGANAVEAALKLARRVSGRPTVLSFTNAFHGLSLGALAVTGSESKRAAAGVPLGNVIRVAYDGFSDGVDGLGLLERMMLDGGCGLDRPGAVIVETVQGEGGLIAARSEWLIRLSELCRRHQLVLIIDDIQMGCGRTGPFLSFEESGIVPDIVCLSKSISGLGLPMAILLLKPELDVWQPGEHSGTFRGNNLAFVTAEAAIREYWSDGLFEFGTRERTKRLEDALVGILRGFPAGAVALRGRGLARGLAFADPGLGVKVSRHAFGAGLLVETSGPRDEVVKLFPPLNIELGQLDEGVRILGAAIRDIFIQ